MEPLPRFSLNTCMLKRDLCPICNTNLVAVNYVKDSITHYRNSCSACIRIGRKLKKERPRWVLAGYKKKERCEVCNFKAKLPVKQLFVYHVDGNLKNCNSYNLKTVCANCRIELIGGALPWKPSPIVPDF